MYGALTSVQQLPAVAGIPSKFVEAKAVMDTGDRVWVARGYVPPLTLDQHIGVRIPGGQPKFSLCYAGFPKSTL